MKNNKNGTAKTLNDITAIILDSIADGVFTVDMSFRITSFNRAAEKITGVSKNEAIYSLCHDVFRANICESLCAMRESIATNKPIVNKRIFIVRPNGKRIPISISTAVLKDPDGKVIGGVETFRDLSIEEELRKRLVNERTFHDIISQNHKMQKLFSLLPLIAQTTSTVLIEGPSGSGKELFAKAIHSLSDRSKKSFITVNSGAIPDTLLESELFGYKAGAFTDARKDKLGKFALAHKGTLFLDEIGDITPALQVRLLRVLQEGEFEPLGATKSVKADVRVITATNKSLDELVHQGKFREDLYYRLNVIKLTLPTLKERKDDILLLVNHFVEKLNKIQGKHIDGISQEALAIIMKHDFPGNVRELQNIIEYAFIMCPKGLILPLHLPEPFHSEKTEIHQGKHRPTSLDEVESQFILETLERNNFNRSQTAKELGINTSTLWRKMKRFNITPPPNKERKV